MNIIRDRVCKFNASENYPSELGFFGSEDNREWKQYQLFEDGVMSIDKCPLIMKKQENK